MVGCNETPFVLLKKEFHNLWNVVKFECFHTDKTFCDLDLFLF